MIFGSRVEDLAWVDGWAARVRPYVRVRREDGVLIKVPSEVHALSETGVRILARALAGDPVRKIAREEGALARPERLLAMHEFFCDTRDLLSGRLGDGTSRRAVRVERFAGSAHRYPVLSEFAVTYRCNLSCSFCYASCGEAEPPATDELGTAEARRVIDVLARDALVPSLSFTGGECTIRKDLPDLVAHAVGRGLRVNLITNGVRCADQDFVATLASAGLHSAQVSLEGPDAATHDGLVGRAGAFERALAGVRNLRDSGLFVHGHTTISRANADRLTEMADLARELGLPRLSMNLIIPTGTPNRPPYRSLRVRYDEVGPLVLAVRERAEALGLEFHWYSPTPFGRFNPIAHGFGNKGCAACDGLIHVAPNAEVLPCSSWNRPVGNLLEEGFETVWFGSRAAWHRQKEHAPGRCVGCEHFALCQGACPLYWEGMGEAEICESRGEARP